MAFGKDLCNNQAIPYPANAANDPPITKNERKRDEIWKEIVDRVDSGWYGMHQ